MSFLSEPKTNMQVYLSHMPMTQAPLTIQPKKLLDVSLTGTTRNKKFTSRTQFKISIHKGGSKEACCSQTICPFFLAVNTHDNSNKLFPEVNSECQISSYL